MFSSVKTKTNSNFVVKRAERSNHSFLLSIWWFDGRLFGRNPLKWGKICLKFWPVMECNIMHQVCGAFYFFFFLKKHLKLSQKTIFWLILIGFWFTSSYALWVTPQSSAKFNFLRRYRLVVSFISLASVALKL